MFPETDGISKLISDTMKVVFQRRLVDRLKALDVPVTDPLLRAASTARDMLDDLHQATMYAGNKHATGPDFDDMAEQAKRRA